VIGNVLVSDPEVGVSAVDLLVPCELEVSRPMMLIGVDPHKSTHTATVLDPVANRPAAWLRIEASLAEYRRLLTWARRWPDRRWAVENASGLGRHLTQWLLARGEVVLDVSPSATARVRQLSRGGGRKNDVIDAAAAATIAAAQGDARPVTAEDDTSVLALLDERRVNLAQACVRVVNQLHALLRDLQPAQLRRLGTCRVADRHPAHHRPEKHIAGTLTPLWMWYVRSIDR
jgi:hypothetical protein